MKKRICDICKINEADKRYKTKRSEHFFDGRNPSVEGYTIFFKIDICEECHKKLFKTR